MTPLSVNGKPVSVDAEPDTPLLYVLRDDLALHGPKFGCGLAQCGYCTSGMIIAAADLLKRNPKPIEAEVRDALAGNLCRCGCHNRIIRAVMRVAQANGRI